MRSPVSMWEAQSRLAPRGAIPWLFLAAAVLLVPRAVMAQPSTARDYEVKAAHLVKFTQYTVWPSNTFTSGKTPLVIGVLGGELLLKQLEREAGGLVGPRRVEVRSISSLEEAGRCHVVFITEAESRKEAEWFEALKGKPILTVGESERSIKRGAVMRFLLKDMSVRFEANLAAAAENRLELDKGMLQVASKVYKGPRPN